MSSALTGLLIFLGLQVTFIGVLLGMARWERLAEPQRVERDDDQLRRQAEPSEMSSSGADAA